MNSSLRYALKALVAVSAAAICGCGGGDGSKELQEGLAAYGAHDLKKAEKLLGESLEKAPDNVDALMAQANVKFELGDFDATQEALDKARKLVGDEPDVIALRSQLAWHVKDIDTARGGFKAMTGPRYDAETQSAGWLGLGILEMTENTGETACDSARVALLKALRLDRRNAAAWYHLGLLYRDAFGNDSAALEQFEVFVRLEELADERVQKVSRTIIPQLKDNIAQSLVALLGSSARDSASAADLIKSAQTAEKSRNYRMAIARYEEACKADPVSFPALVGYAAVLQEHSTAANAKAKALECYLKACKIRPGSVKTLIATGTLAAKLDNPAVAVEAFSRAVAADPANITAIDGLIRALRRSGRASTGSLYQEYRDSLSVKKAK